jgi:hypothetical protein
MKPLVNRNPNWEKLAIAWESGINSDNNDLPLKSAQVNQEGSNASGIALPKPRR